MSLDKPADGECEGCKALALEVQRLRDSLWALEDKVNALQQEIDDTLSTVNGLLRFTRENHD